MGIDYVNKKDAIKTIEAEIKELRTPLEAYLKENGKELPNGSRLAVVTHADKDVHLKQTLRVSKVLLPEAIDVLKANKLDACIESVEVIREDVLEQMYNMGQIKDDILTKVYKEKPTYAFSVELKDKMSDGPEV